jgi:hypothetical protein
VRQPFDKLRVNGNSDENGINTTNSIATRADSVPVSATFQSQKPEETAPKTKISPKPLFLVAV